MNEGSASSTPSEQPTTSGTLKCTISLKSGQILTPFHTFKPELPGKSELQGSYDLLASYDLGGIYQTQTIREDLASFLPHLYGNFNFSVSQDASSLKMLVEKPPIHKEITNLSSAAMQGFRLSTGPVDERYRYLFDRKKEEPESLIEYDEKRDVIRLKSGLESINKERDVIDDGFRKKHKKKKSKKEKKKKRESAARQDESALSRSFSGKNVVKPDPMEF